MPQISDKGRAYHTCRGTDRHRSVEEEEEALDVSHPFLDCVRCQTNVVVGGKKKEEDMCANLRIPTVL